jgi:hypothetical protein
MKGHPELIDVGGEDTLLDEPRYLGPDHGEERAEHPDPRLFAGGRGAHHVEERQAVVANELGDPVADLDQHGGRRAFEIELFDRLGGKLENVSIDGVPQPRLGAEVMLDQPRRDTGGGGDVTDRGRPNPAQSESLKRRIPYSRDRRQIFLGNPHRSASVLDLIR